MKHKWLLWSLCIAVYLMQLPFVGLIAALLVDTDGVPDTAVVAVEIVCLGFCILSVLLCFANLAAAITGIFKELPAPYRTTAAVKIALIPFYVLNFFIWAILIVGTLNPFFLGVAVVFLVVSLLSTYVFMLATGVHNIARLLKRAWEEKDVKEVFWIIPHFIYFADVVAAILLWRREKNLAPPAVPPAYRETETAEEA